MKQCFSPVLVATLVALFLTACGGHQPLPPLSYRGTTPMGNSEPITATVSLEAGQSIGHSLTSYALMPGGYAMPITSGPSPAGAFNVDDQAAFVENLVRVLTERGVIQLVSVDKSPAATITVKFLKTEHFPEMQDYVLDVLVTARAADKHYERVHHVSTIDGVNVVARMFQHGIDGRRRAAELLLSVVIEDLEKWHHSSISAGTDGSRAHYVSRAFDLCSAELIDYLRDRYARPSTFWKDGISVRAVRPSENVAVVELRWSDADGLPPFCIVDLYAQESGTRIVLQERDRLLVGNAKVAEGIREYIASVQSINPASPGSSAP